VNTFKPTILLLLLPALYGCGGRAVEFLLPDDTGPDTGGDSDTGNAPPFVVTTVPVNAQLGVNVAVTPNATFSEAMLPASFGVDSFTVEQGTDLVAGTLGLDASSTILTFTPDQPLDLDAVYTATITTDAEDASGLAMTDDYTWTFTTADVAVEPQVIATTPVDAAVGVRVGVAPTATFSVSMDPATITSTTFLVENGTNVVSGSVSLDGGSDIATFVPDAPLEFGAVYTATITTGALDLSGVSIPADYVWSFSTEAADAPPVVIYTTPFDAESGVSVDARPTATFSEDMDASTLTGLTFLVEQGASPVAGTVTFDSGTDTAMFTPDVALTYGLAYTATITTGAEDAGGLAMVTDYAWTFTTGDTPPEVIFTDPADGEAGVPVDIVPAATFSVPMDVATIDETSFLVAQGSTPVTGLVVLDTTTDTAMFTPDVALVPGLVYTATVTTAAQDLSGTGLVSDYTWSFSTEGADAPPLVIYTTPADAESDVAVDAQPTATFSEDMDASTVTGLTFYVEQAGTPVAGTVSFDSGTDTATFTPDVPLDYGLAYTATVTTGAEDAGGLAMLADYTWTFSTGDTPPEVIFTDPEDGETGVSLDVTPVATFSEPMDIATIDETSFLLYQGTTQVLGGVVLDTTTDTAMFTPDVALVPGLIYTATITTAAQDLSGVPMASDYQWSFSPSAVAPEVILTNPLDLATGVSVNTLPSATFSVPMDPATLTELTFLVQEGTNIVGGSVSLDETTNTATFTPDVAFDAGVTYMATVTTGAEDLAGTGLASNYSWTFSTDACSLATLDLGSASGFTVLAGSTVTNTGATIVTGDVGVSPSTAVTGFPPGIVIGSVHSADPTSAGGIADLTTAYNTAAGLSLCPIVAAGNLGGQTADAGAVQVHVVDRDLVGGPDARRARGQLGGVGLPDRVDADHHGGAAGDPDERRAGGERVLAGRHVCDHRHDERVRRHHHGGPVRHVGDRRYAQRPCARADRGGHAGHQHRDHAVA